MTYGTASSETMTVLREHGLEMVTYVDYEDDPDDPGASRPTNAAARIDVTVFGALDESFEITDMFHHTQVVDLIAERLKLNSELDDWCVEAYHPNPDLCEMLYRVTNNPDMVAR